VAKAFQVNVRVRTIIGLFSWEYLRSTRKGLVVLGGGRGNDKRWRWRGEHNRQPLGNSPYPADDEVLIG